MLSPYSNVKSSFVFPEQVMSMSLRNMKLLNLPLKSTIIGLLFAFLVLRTRTAFPVGDVVVDGTVAVVTSGADVGSRQSKPLQGHPAAQFSY